MPFRRDLHFLGEGILVIPHREPSVMACGAIILAGGRSTRMGCDKAMLPFGPGEVMLQRVVRLVGEGVRGRRIVVVAAAGQELPRLPHNVVIARDRRPGRGPMEGLAAGLSAIGGRLDGVFLSCCDAPLLKPAFVRRLFDVAAASGRSIEIVVPREGARYHPLSAVYRPCVLPVVEELLATDQLQLRLLFHRCPTREVAAEEFRDVDPELESLTNCNRPEGYARALARCGLGDEN